MPRNTIARHGDPKVLFGLCEALLAHRFMSDNNTVAGDDQNERVDATEFNLDVRFLLSRPEISAAKSEHDVRADESGEEHDFRTEEQPQRQLTVGDGQAHFDGRWLCV